VVLHGDERMPRESVFVNVFQREKRGFTTIATHFKLRYFLLKVMNFV